MLTSKEVSPEMLLASLQVVTLLAVWLKRLMIEFGSTLLAQRLTVADESGRKNHMFKRRKPWAGPMLFSSRRLMQQSRKSCVDTCFSKAFLSVCGKVLLDHYFMKSQRCGQILFSLFPGGTGVGRFGLIDELLKRETFVFLSPDSRWVSITLVLWAFSSITLCISLA